jgi:DNA-directed RNA polymerase specialized sigma24 family protein
VGPARPEDLIAAREFSLARRECVEHLAPRARQAWFRRVFLERPSREIAGALALSPAHVDVVVQRARAALRECMRRQGHPDAEMRPGAFVEIWASLGSLAREGPGSEEAHDTE